MKKFNQLYVSKVAELEVPVEKPREDLLIKTGKLILGALCVFTFLAGLIFTDIPLLRNIITHFNTHIIIPVEQWMAADPRTGRALEFLIYATIASIILYATRMRLYVLGLWCLANIEKWIDDLRARAIVKNFFSVPKKPTLTPESKTATIEPAEDKFAQF